MNEKEQAAVTEEIRTAGTETGVSGAGTGAGSEIGVPGTGSENGVPGAGTGAESTFTETGTGTAAESKASGSGTETGTGANAENKVTESKASGAGSIAENETSQTATGAETVSAVSEGINVRASDAGIGTDPKTAAVSAEEASDKGLSTESGKDPEPIFSEEIIEKGLRGNVGAEPQQEAQKAATIDSERVSENGQPQSGGTAVSGSEAVSEAAAGSMESTAEEGKNGVQHSPAPVTDAKGKPISDSKQDVVGDYESNAASVSNTESASNTQSASNTGSASNTDSADRTDTEGKTGTEMAKVTSANGVTSLPARDYEAEWKELAEAHPEVIGTTLPEDVFQACIKSGQPPLRVYESMMLQKMRTEVERLKQENERLRQNHENAQRAPVTGTLEGGATGVKEEDAFIAAFKRYR